MTTGGLARRLGVSPTTLRSWDRRYGLGPAVRADGRHRRWTPQDVAVLEAMCRLTSAGIPPGEAARAAKAGDAGTRERSASGGSLRAAPGRPAGHGPPAGDHEKPVPGQGGPATGHRAPGVPDRPSGTGPTADEGPPGSGGRSRAAGTLPLGDVRQECRGLARAAVRLDAPALDGQLAAAVERYGLTVAWQEVMMPTLHAVGRKWASSGDRYVEVEHLLSWHISTALRRVTPMSPAGPPDTAQGPVVLACVPGEQHTLPLEALNAGLAERSLPARMLGAAVPAEALTAAVRRLGPVAVVLWAQARSTASLPLARHVAATRWGVRGARRQPAVVLGGPGWTGRSAQGMLRPPSLDEALSVLTAHYEQAVPGR
ncbi:MerR family transcriptional regulator [Streptomyces sp. V3I8]|uniref:MerR family transcriptional regulator n=1 Tax=Streptomyces sp. V3I8 TaxID=3042279 RepID=UPI0027D85F90|nr:MerR family transcriptional regulator [Streptomyces sp. V3I8]